MESNNIVIAKKSSRIAVRTAVTTEELKVWTKNGNLEANEVVHGGELIATRVDATGNPVVDKFGHENTWKISQEVLDKKYAEEDDGIYIPKGGKQVFKKLNEDTVFMVPWGENGALIEQKILAGGWANITDPSDVYGIAEEEFSETYEIVGTLGVIEPIALSSIRYYKGRIPIGILTNSRGTEVGYLSPFRGYSFQVSDDFEGHGDSGSTQVFGLNNVLDARLGTERTLGHQSNIRMDTLKAYLLELAAKEAIHQFCGKTWLLAREYDCDEMAYVFRDTKCEPYLGDGRKLPLIFGATMLQRFIALCIKWLSPELYQVYTNECDTAVESAKDIAYHEKALDDTCNSSYHARRVEAIKRDVALLANLKANEFKIGDRVITISKLSSFTRTIEPGTVVTITGIGDRGYDLVDDKGNKVIECGWNCIDELV